MLKNYFKKGSYLRINILILFCFIFGALFFILPNIAQAVLCGPAWELFGVDMLSISVSGNELTIVGTLDNGYCEQHCGSLTVPNGIWAVAGPLGELQYQIDNTSDGGWIDLAYGFPAGPTGQWEQTRNASPTECTEEGPFGTAYKSAAYLFDTSINPIILAGTQLNPGNHVLYLKQYFDIGQNGYEWFNYSIPSADFDFTLSANPSSGISRMGASINSTITVTKTVGTASAVSFSAVSSPPGPTATFSPSSCTPSISTCTTTMTVNPNSSPDGTYIIIVSGTTGLTTRATTFTLQTSNNPVDILIRPGGTTNPFSNGPITINSGQGAELQWVTNGAGSCSAYATPVNSLWTGAVSLSGSTTITGLTLSTNFELRCTNTYHYTGTYETEVGDCSQFEQYYPFRIYNTAGDGISYRINGGAWTNLTQGSQWTQTSGFCADGCVEDVCVNIYQIDFFTPNLAVGSYTLELRYRIYDTRFKNNYYESGPQINFAVSEFSDTVTANVNHAPDVPTLIAPANVSYVNAAASDPTFSATVTDSDTGQTIRANFEVSGFGTGSGGYVTTSGTSSWGPVSGIADGTYSWRAYAEDNLGAISANSANYAFTKDTVPPTADIQYTEGTITTTSIPITLIETDERTGVVAGTAITQVSINGGAFSTINTGVSDFAYTGANGNTYIFRYTVYDGAGNTATDIGGSVTINTSIGVTFTGKLSTNPTYVEGPITVNSGSSINLQWTATNATSCTGSGGTWSGGLAIPSGTATIANVTATTTFTISCSNASANTSDTFVVNINALPAVPTNLLPTGNIRVNPTFSATVSDPNAGQTVRAVFHITGGVDYTGTSVANTGGSSTIAATLADGTYIYYAWAEDNMSAISANSANYAFTKDTVPPTADIQYTEGTITTTSIPITLIETDERTGVVAGTAITQVSINGGAFSTINTGVSNFTYTGANGNTYIFRYTVYDGAGNTATDIGGSVAVDASIGVTFMGKLSTSPTYVEGPIIVNSGSNINLQWTATNATSCTGSGGTWSGSLAIPSGTATIANVTATTTFTISCSNASANTSDTFVVNINALPAVPTNLLPTGNIRVDPTFSATVSDPNAGQTVRAIFHIVGGLDYIGSSVANTGGSSTIAATLADGTYIYYAWAQDNMSAISANSANWSFTRDTVLPTADIQYTEGTITTTSIPITLIETDERTGVVAGTAITQVSINGGAFSTINTGVSNFNYTGTNGNTYVFRYTVYDGAGNTATDIGGSVAVDASIGVTFMGKLSTSPTYVEGPIIVNSGSNINLQWTATNATSCTGSGGTWSGSLAIPSGTATIANVTATTTFTISCSNASANTSDNFVVNINALPAVPTNLLPTGNIRVNPTFSATVSDPNAGQTVRAIFHIVGGLDYPGTSVANTGGTSSVNVTLADGAYIYYAWAVDNMSAISANSANWSFTRDTVLPTADIQYTEGTITTTTIPLTLLEADERTGVVAGTAITQVSINGGAFSTINTGVSNFTYTGANGNTYVFRYTVYDGAGNTATDIGGSVTITIVANADPTATALNLNNSDFCSASPAYFFSWIYADTDGDRENRFDLQIDDSGATFPSPEVNRSYSGLSNPSPTTNNQATIVLLTAQADYLTYNRTYNWRVRVYDATGLDSGWTDGVPFSFLTPTHRSPACNFTWSPISPNPGESTSFTDSSTCYDISGNSTPCTNWNWTFTDGNPGTSTQQNPITQFTTSGTKDVTLRVIDSFGSQCSLTRQVIVSLPLPKWKEIRPW